MKLFLDELRCLISYLSQGLATCDKLARHQLKAPERVTLTRMERVGLQDHAPFLEKWGFRFTMEGGDTFSVLLKSVPSVLGTPLTSSDFKEVCAQCGDSAWMTQHVRPPCITRLLNSKVGVLCCMSLVSITAEYCLFP